MTEATTWPKEWIRAIEQSAFEYGFYIADDQFVKILDALAAVGAIRTPPVGEQATELVAKWMMSNGYATGHGDDVDDLLKALSWQHKERMERQQAQPATVEEVARIIAFEKYAFALSVSKDAALRRVTRGQIENVFQSAWDEDAGDIRSIGLIAAQAIMSAFDVRKK